MKILIVFSGSQGHFHGVNRFIDYISVNDDIVYASHIGLQEKYLRDIRYIHLSSPQAFLDYEFLHYQDLKKIIPIKSDRVYYQHRKKVFKELINTVQPDVILQDNHSYTDALILAELYRKSKIKLLFFQTRLSTACTGNSLYGGYSGKEMKFLTGRRVSRRKKFRMWHKKLSMPGLNENHRILTLIKSLNLQHVELNTRRYELDSLTYVPEIILSGSDLSNHKEGNQFFTGLCLPKKKSKTVVGIDRMNIMVSSGSRSHSYSDFDSFLEAIKGIVSHYPSSIFHLPLNLVGKISGDNISYYQWDTYHDHLSQADLHITHGGINSIKDSLNYRIPMLICPLDWRSDQIHNALMFERLDFSLTWNIRKDDFESIKEKIEILLGGEYENKIQEYVSPDQKRYSVDIVRDEFVGLIKDDRWEIRNW